MRLKYALKRNKGGTENLNFSGIEYKHIPLINFGVLMSDFMRFILRFCSTK